MRKRLEAALRMQWLILAVSLGSMWAVVWLSRNLWYDVCDGWCWQFWGWVGVIALLSVFLLAMQLLAWARWRRIRQCAEPEAED